VPGVELIALPEAAEPIPPPLEVVPAPERPIEDKLPEFKFALPLAEVPAAPNPEMLPLVAPPRVMVRMPFPGVALKFAPAEEPTPCTWLVCMSRG
jgi:hypothetical protein